MTNFRQWLENTEVAPHIIFLATNRVPEAVQISQMVKRPVSAEEISLQAQIGGGLGAYAGDDKMVGWTTYDLRSAPIKYRVITHFYAIDDNTAKFLMEKCKQQVAMVFATFDIGESANIRAAKAAGLQFLQSVNDKVVFVAPKTEQSEEVYQSYLEHPHPALQQQNPHEPETGPHGFVPPSSSFIPHKPWTPGQDEEEDEDLV